MAIQIALKTVLRSRIIFTLLQKAIFNNLHMLTIWFGTGATSLTGLAVAPPKII
jgi:hypothetical protein